MNDQQQVEQLLRFGHACLSLTTYEEDYAFSLVHGAALSLNRPLWLWTVTDGVRDGLLTTSSPVSSTDKPVAGLAHFAELNGRPICVTLDLAVHLRDERTLRVFRNLLHRFQQTGGQLVMIDHAESVTPVVAEYATPVELSLPDEQELERIVRDTLRRANREKPIAVEIKRAGWNTIIRSLRGLTRRQAERVVADTVAEDRRLDDQDIHLVLTEKRRMLHKGRLLEYVQTPVDLSEIGGLRRLKHWLQQRESALTPSGREFGLVPPRGVLMLGVQGAGKSLCAKAIATAWQRPLLRMDVGALYDLYVGESERRLRDALRQAESMAPIVLWIDEIEKAFASAAARSTDGGLSQRMFATLLTWMQEHLSSVFLVATANDIEALPPELLRKGRFDEIFFVDLPTREVRRDICAIHLKKRQRDPQQFNLDALADAADGYSGAEIEQAVIAALHDAFSAGVALTTEHIRKALQDSPPLSVTMSERVEALRAWAQGRCVPADA